MTLQARNIVLQQKIDPETLNVTSCRFSFEVYSEELGENWDTIEVSYNLGSEPIEIRHVVYYAGAEEEYMNLSDLKEELEDDGISYDDIVYFAKLQINRLTTKHLGRLF